MKRCVNCGEPVQEFNYALGPMLMHVDPLAPFPTTAKGTAWLYCRQQVATLDGSAS